MLVVQTPLRLSFLGGGTDFENFYLKYGGAVLSTAINKYTFAIIKERFDNMVYINYSKKEVVDNISKLEHDLVREAMKLTGVENGVEITTLADVPSEGTGLGSSSSVTVALLHALHTYRGQLVTAQTLAEEACWIEINVLGKPIGRQDQYAAAFGDMNFITFDSSGVKVEKVKMTADGKRQLNDALLLFYTGITRQASKILSEQKANLIQHVDVLNEMKALALKARDAIQQGAFDEFGEMMHSGWELKKELAGNITNPEIDKIYESARKAGAIGGKIPGAGGGGFLLLYCNSQKENVRHALRGLRELPFHFQADGSKVIFNYRSAE